MVMADKMIDRLESDLLSSFSKAKKLKLCNE